VTNTLYYGDNLHILRERIGPETIDLVYLDPPFNSNRSYTSSSRTSHTPRVWMPPIRSRLPPRP